MDPAKGLTMPENTSKPGNSASPAEEMTGDGRSPHTPHATPGESLHAAQRKFEELFQYLRYFLAAKLDLLRVAAGWQVVMLAALIVAALAATALIVTAVVLLCLGISDGLSDLFGHRWIGELVTALLLMAVMVISASLIVTSIFGSRRRKTVERYEAMRRRQQRVHHRDVQNWPEGAAQQEGAQRGPAAASRASNPGAERRES
jgi:hypothetical protein